MIRTQFPKLSYDIFRKNLVWLLESTNTKPRTLSEFLEHNRGSVYRYTQDGNRRDPGYTVLARIADFFDVSVEWLLTGSPEDVKRPADIHDFLSLYAQADAEDKALIDAVLTKYRQENYNFQSFQPNNIPVVEDIPESATD